MWDQDEEYKNPSLEEEEETEEEEQPTDGGILGGGLGSKAAGLNPDTDEEDYSILGGNPYAKTEPDYTYNATDPKAWLNDTDFDTALDNFLNPNKEEEQPVVAPQTITMPGRIEELKANVDEAKARQDEAVAQQKATLQSLVDLYSTQAEEAKPTITQEELDSRRAKSTSLAMLTSALANIANGIAVGKGAINATIPDGYQAAYQHWDDVQKKHSARRAEYDKLIQAVMEKRGKIADLDYASASGDLKTATSAYEREADRENRLAVQRLRNEGELEKAKEVETIKGKNAVAVQQEKNKAPRRTSGGGGGGSKSTTSSSLEDYRTYRDVSIPQSVAVDAAWSRMAEKAAEYLESTKTGKTSSQKEEIQKKIDAINKKKTMVGSASERKTKIKALIEAFDAAEIPSDVLQDALAGMQTTQSTTQQPKKNTNTNKKAGGTSGKGDASKFEMN